MADTTTFGRRIAVGTLAAAGVIGGWWWMNQPTDERPAGIELVDPAALPPVEPVQATDVAVTVRGVDGAPTTGGKTIDANSTCRIAVRFKLPTDRETLPSGVLTVYKTKPNGGRTIMQQARSTKVTRIDGQLWEAEFQVNRIRVPGEFGVEVHGWGSNRFEYHVAAGTTVKVVK